MKKNFILYISRFIILNAIFFYEVFYKKAPLKFLQTLQENSCGRVSFLIKFQVWGLQLYFKKLQNFEEHPFYRAPPKE